jgi:hypothetical protein
LVMTETFEWREGDCSSYSRMLPDEFCLCARLYFEHYYVGGEVVNARVLGVKILETS